MTYSVTVVDESDTPVSAASSYQIYSKGLLHRFASIFVIDTDSGCIRLLLQKRGIGKSHGGLFSESVSAHVRYDESYNQAASRRLSEEIGVHCQANLKEICKIHVNVCEPETEWRKNAFVTIYQCYLSENEIMKGLEINPSEVLNVYFLPLDKVINFFNASPGFFVPCFRYTLEAYLEYAGYKEYANDDRFLVNK
jgi:isopentenyl-diphosphate Delta-isomerase